MDRTTGICELTLQTSDLETLERFYLELGLEPLTRETDRVWLAAGPRSRLGIWCPGEREHGDEGGRHVHFALSVDDAGIERALATLRSAGTEVEGPIEHDGGDRSIYFDDPAGNRVELWNFFEMGAGAERGVDALAD